MTIGKIIQEKRKRVGLTQKQLAEKVSVATITIQQYERNVREPKFDMLEKISEALSCSPMEFWQNADYMTGEDGHIFVGMAKTAEILQLKRDAERAVTVHDSVAQDEIREQLYSELGKIWDARILAVYRPLPDAEEEKAISYCEWLLSQQEDNQQTESNIPDNKEPVEK